MLQALYETEGTVGEGAFGVVLKAAVKLTHSQHQHAAAPGPIDAAAASSSVSSAAGAAATAAAPSVEPPRHYVAIKKMLNHREGQGIPQDAYREIKVHTPCMRAGCASAE